MDNSTLNISNGSDMYIEGGGTSSVSISGGTYDTVNMNEYSSLDVSDGSILWLGIGENVAATISGGTVETLAGGGSAIEMTGGQVMAADLRGTSTLNMSGGSLAGSILQESVTYNISGTADIGDSVHCWDDSTLNISNGSNMRIDALGTSSVGISGGTYDEVFMHESSSIDVSDGSIQILNLYGPGATATVSGGIIGELSASDSDVDLLGGEIVERIGAIGSSTITIHGYGFIYDEFGGSWNGGILSGYWMDGTAFSMDFYDGLAGESTYYDHVVLVPEPASMLLLGLGAAVLLRRRIKAS